MSRSGTGSRGPRRRVVGVVTAAALAAAVVVAGVVTLVDPFGGDDQASTTSPAAAGASPTATEPAPERDGAASVPAPSASAAPVAAGHRPVRITIPAIGVDSTLTALGIAADGTIEVPRQPRRAGWLTSSAAPGDRGPAVIAGHVDSTTGPAVFYRLRQLEVGDAIVVTRRDGTRARFTVDGLDVVAKDQFPTEATYGPVPGPALRLITCGGPYEKARGGYLDNVVVFAT